MATSAEQNQLKQAKENETSQTPGSTTGTPGVTTSRVADYSSGASPTASQGSGRFTNLKKYVNANQGAGDQLGSKITNTISSNLNKTEKEATTGTNEIANQVQAEKDRLAAGSGYNAQLQDQTQDGASAIYGNETDKAAFANLLKNQNNATTLATNAQSAADTATAGLNNVSGQINNLGTEAGRFALLQQSIKNPQYTQGQQRLDQLFLQAGNPNQLVQNQRDLSKQLSGVSGTLADTYANLDAGINQVGTQAQDVSTMLGNTLNSQTQNLINAQIAEAAAKNTGNAAANSAIQTYFTNGYGSLTAEQKALIDPMLQGANLTTGMRTYNVLNEPQSYQNYTTSGSTDLTQADVLDQNEYNRYNALFNLAGGTGNAAYTGAGAGGTDASISGNLAIDIAGQRTALENLLNSQYSFGPQAGYGTTTTASSNYLDLLKALEAGNTYGVGDANSPIKQTGASNIDPAYAIFQNGQNPYGRNDLNLGLSPWNMAVSDSSASRRDSIEDLISDFMSKINSSGYTNKLG